MEKAGAYLCVERSVHGAYGGCCAYNDGQPEISVSRKNILNLTSLLRIDQNTCPFAIVPVKSWCIYWLCQFSKVVNLKASHFTLYSSCVSNVSLRSACSIASCQIVWVIVVAFTLAILFSILDD